jgi:hypothetical protein
MNLPFLKKFIISLGFFSWSAYAGNWTIEIPDSKTLSAPTNESVKFSVLSPEWNCELLRETLNFAVQSRSVVCVSKKQSLVSLNIDCPIKGHEHGPTTFKLGRVGKNGMEFRSVEIGCQLEKTASTQ